MKLDMRKKQEKKETTKVTKKLPMTAKMKRAMAVYIAMVLFMTAGARVRIMCWVFCCLYLIFLAR